MKKLSTLIAILLIATIGGVYATWNYVGNEQVHSFTTKGVIMEEVVVEGSVGGYAITSTLVQGRIDQAKGDDTTPSKYHKAVLNYELSGTAQLSITFTPTSTAGLDVKSSGVVTYLWFGDGGMTYKTDEAGNYNANGTAKSIFNVPHGEDNYITIHPEGTVLDGMDRDRNFAWEDGENGSFVFNFIGSNAAHQDFSAVFTLNDFVLDQESEYYAFKNSINAFIRCVVSNKVPSETTLPNA